jgi:predicted dehydrogenase
MTDRLRVGIAGVGFIGKVHAHAARTAGAVLAAVAANTPERSRAAAQSLQAERACSAEELVVADDIDVVHVCTPNHLHVPLAKAALSAGKHVICEKPLAPNLADARRLVSSAAEAAVVAAVPFVYRFYPTVREARARIRRGEAGPLQLLHGSYLQDYNWRVDPALGGASRAFGDIGVHWCDLVEFVTGHRIARLTARTHTAFPERQLDGGGAAAGTEDAATVLFETDRSVPGSLVVSQISTGRKNRLWFSLDGAAASYVFDQELPDSLWVGTRDDNRVLPRGSESFSQEARRYAFLPAGHPQGFQDCFNAFVADVYAAIGGEQPDGLPTFADGLRAARLTAAVLESAATRSWVEVSE